MGERFNTYKTQLISFWSGLSWVKRGITLGVLACTLGAISYLLLHEPKVEYGYLFTDLDPATGGRIVERLREKGIPYRIQNGGTTIMVPQKVVYELRMEMATSGLTTGSGVGFELFDKSQFGVTDFVQKINYKRAMEGELSRTISSLKAIRSARVHLVIPKKRLFTTSQEKASASVVLALHQGQELSKKAVQGIQNLVSGSIQNLKPNNIHIVDSTGEVLSVDQEELEKSSIFTLRKRMERDYERRIRRMLERMLGQGKAIVRVSLAMDFTKKSAVKEVYNPEGQVVRSERKQIIATNQKGGTVKGIPGARANLPGGPVEKKQGSQGGIKTVKSHTNYEIDKTITKVVEPVGQRRSISVAVAVDGLYTKNTKGVATYSPLPKASLKAISELVKSAVGFNARAGDQVEVRNFQFSKTPSEPPTHSSPKSFSRFLPYLVGGATGLLLLVLLVLFLILPRYRNYKRMKVREAAIMSEIQETGYRPTPIKIIEEKLDAPAVEGQKILIDSSSETEENEDVMETQRNQVLHLVESDPDRTVAILKNWIASVPQ